MTAHILLVDDDEKICRLISRLLQRDGYDVSYALNVNDALEYALTTNIDLIITDIMMPNIDGMQFLELIRTGKTNFNKQIPIIMVSALYELSDKISGLKEGADDYLVKPFEPEELSVRVKTILRRLPPRQDIDIHSINDNDGCILDIQNSCLTINNNNIDLSDNECLFLKILMQNINIPISKHEITRQLYPDLINNPESRTSEVMIGRLRKKLEENNCQKIITKRGDGYYWQVIEK